MHTHTYQISCKPPALRAMLTSSLPYFSSADALQRQNHPTAETRPNDVTFYMYV